MLSVYVRDERDLSRAGQIDYFESLTCIERLHGAGRWVIQAPLSSPGMDLFLELGEHAGIVVQDEATKRVVFAGPVGVDASGRPTIVRDLVGAGEELVSRLTVTGSDDTGRLADRLALPQPLTAAPPFSVQAHDVLTGPATTVLLDLIDRNAGPSAVAARQITGLSIGVDPAQGSTITARARYQTLLSFLAELATAGGVTFEVRQVGAQLVASARLVADVSAEVAFSPAFGNLASFTYSVEAATGTAVYVAGQGEGTARMVVLTAGTGRRIEQFVDRRDVDDWAELGAAATVALAEGAGRTSLVVEPIDTTSALYGKDYRLGDRVAVIVDGERITDVVTTVTTTVQGEEFARRITVGPEDNRGPAALYAGLSTLGRRVRQLERI